MEKKNRFLSLLSFLAAFAFFQFAYPYHLVRREQMTLFLYDWDYIAQTTGASGGSPVSRAISWSSSSTCPWRVRSPWPCC